MVSKQQTLALQVLALRRGPLQTSAAIPLYSTLLISRAIGLKLRLAQEKENEYRSLKMQGLRHPSTIHSLNLPNQDYKSVCPLHLSSAYTLRAIENSASTLNAKLVI